MNKKLFGFLKLFRKSRKKTVAVGLLIILTLVFTIALVLNLPNKAEAAWALPRWGNAPEGGMVPLNDILLICTTFIFYVASRIANIILAKQTVFLDDLDSIIQEQINQLKTEFRLSSLGLKYFRLDKRRDILNIPLRKNHI